jgi:hypothetical protein
VVPGPGDGGLPLPPRAARLGVRRPAGMAPENGQGSLLTGHWLGVGRRVPISNPLCLCRERAKFMDQNNLAYDVVSKEDVQRVKAQLASIPIPNQQPGHSAPVDVTRTQFFRIPFTQALDLVANRQVRGNGA